MYAFIKHFYILTIFASLFIFYKNNCEEYLYTCEFLDNFLLLKNNLYMISILLASSIILLSKIYITFMYNVVILVFSLIHDE
jgi:hypothetical protein